MFDKQNLVGYWRKEYMQKGIPSSFREEPSGSVMKFVSFLKEQGVRNGSALDLGCGRGRNSIYLAEQGFDVSSIDFVPDMIESLRQQSEMLDLTDRVHGYCQSVTELWPFPDQTFDVAFDAFCYKHQVIASEKVVYRQELARVMRPGSFYLLTLAGIDDGYYSLFPVSSSTSDGQMIIDPANGIPSILYTKEDVVREFAGAFDLVHFTHKLREGVMHGAMYQRSTYVFIFSRR